MDKRKFHNEILTDLTAFLKEQDSVFEKKNRLKIDLHCHDKNSSEPDELIGRLLGVPETWISSKKVLKSLKKSGCDTFTITNHNNAKSCYKLQDKGYDILTGAEFSVTVPDFNAGIHVLAYGFTPEQEAILNRKRENLYKFQEYAVENNIPTIWAHPLFHYHSNSIPNMDLFEKLSLVFDRFEVMNGQRDSWQNMLVKNWIESFTPEKIDNAATKFGLSANTFSNAPYKKVMTGGSDEHMGIFTGLTGTYLKVDNLASRLKTETRSALALEALINKETAVFGSHHNSEKMTVAFMDYFCQIGLNIKDPGLIRMLLHKGDAKEKFYSLLIANGFFELRRHKITTGFLKVIHNSFSGEKPSLSKKIIVPKHYKPVFNQINKIAKASNADAENKPKILKDSIETIYTELTDLLSKRLTKKIKKYSSKHKNAEFNINKIFDNFELPSNIRSLLTGESYTKSKRVSNPDFKDIIDGLSFPSLAAAVITSATFASAKVLYNTRPLLEKFSENLNIFKHPKRMLWLTDTFEDSNGVAMVLNSVLDYIKKNNLPIDLCVCSSKLESSDHLIVIPPKAEFTLPFYKQQPIRIPDILELHNLFKENEYDRLICSTEGFMGAASVFLKKAYSVPAYFFIHTDWMTFADKVLNFNKHNKNRLKRFMRTFYRQFDEIFVLNSDQQKWFTSSAMNLDKKHVHLTAHWTDSGFNPTSINKKDVFGISNDEPLILFAGRLSKEKGVDEIPKIYKKVKKAIPNVKIAFAGVGPEEKTLQESIPDAIFCGWVNHEDLPNYYSSADLLVLPSKFDTFGCVVLEALSCGLPVAAYKTKGPKDIIEDNTNGYLAVSRKELTEKITYFLENKNIHSSFRKSAIERAKEYNPDKIMSAMLNTIRLK